jgi:hypothetical protein
MIIPRTAVGKIVRGEITHLLRPGSTRAPKVGQRRFIKASQRDEIACHIVILDVVERLAGQIEFADARKLGYRTTDQFKAAWVQEHDIPWLNRQMAAMLPFPDDLEFAARFDGRHAPRKVYVVRFEVDRSEQPRFLMEGSPLTDGGKARLMSNRKVKPRKAKPREVTGPEETGYASSAARALSHEPEPVDAQTQDRFSREGHQGWVAREGQRELDRELLSAEERMRLVRIDARAQGVDIGHLEASILQRVRAAERKVHHHRKKAA